MSKGAVLADLRIILRHLKTLPSDGSNSFKAYAMAQVRANMTNNDEEEVRELRWKAHDAAQMVTALGVRKDLLDLHAGEKMSQEERIKLTAYRVGLNTPELYDTDKAAAVSAAAAAAAAADNEGGGGMGSAVRPEAAAETIERTGT